MKNRLYANCLIGKLSRISVNKITLPILTSWAENWEDEKREIYIER